MLFKYKAITQAGETLEGTYEASSESEVISMIKFNNNIPLEIKQDIETEKQIEIFKSKVKKRDLAVFCRQFYTMLDSGIGIVRALEILEKQTENKTLKKTIASLHEEVQKGISLSDAMKEEGRIFPSMLVNMVEAGEASGNLDSIMDRMASHYEKEYKLENKVKSSLIYPTVLAVVSIGVVIFMLTFVMPTFVGMYESSGNELHPLTQGVMNLSSFIRTQWLILVILIGGLIVGLNIFKQTDNGRDIIDNLKLKIPIVKKTMIQLITARFTRTLSTLMSSGISLLQALEIVAKAIGNSVIEKRIVSSVEEIRKGMTLSNAVKIVDIFPPMVDSMVRIGEESGALDEMLAKTADFYDEEAEVGLQRLASLLEPLMIVFMALVIGLIAVAMVIPMFDMVNMV